MKTTAQPLSTAQLREFAEQHPCDFRRYHAIVLLGVDWPNALPVNPFDEYTTAKLRQELNIAGHCDPFLRDAIQAEIDRRDAERQELNGNPKANGDITLRNASWNHPERPLGGSDVEPPRDSDGQILDVFPFNGTGAFFGRFSMGSL